MIWLYYFILFILGTAVIFVVVMMITLIRTRVPFVSLSKKKVDKVLDLVRLDSSKKLYDLGCGDARFLVRAYKKYNISGVGYELNWWALLRSKWNVFIYKADVAIYNKNFLKIDLDDADYIFIYLVSEALIKLEKKLLTNPRSARQVISYGFKFPNLKPTEVLYTEDRKDRGRVYIYNI